jgi:hypothetical protein
VIVLCKFLDHFPTAKLMGGRLGDFALGHSTKDGYSLFRQTWCNKQGHHIVGGCMKSKLLGTAVYAVANLRSGSAKGDRILGSGIYAQVELGKDGHSERFCHISIYQH